MKNAMNKIIFGLSMMVLVMSVVLSCSNPPVDILGPYNNTLRFYDGGYPMTMVLKKYLGEGHSKPKYSSYVEHEGIMNSTNYNTLLNKTNLVNIEYNSSIWITNYLTNSNYSIYWGRAEFNWPVPIVVNNLLVETNGYFINANSKYMAINYSNRLKIFSIPNMSLVFYSSNIIKYYWWQEGENNFTEVLFAHNSNMVVYRTSDLKVVLVNLTNSNETIIGDGFSVGAFSANDKYLFYTDFGRKNDYSRWDNLYNDKHEKHCGQPYIYEISTGSNYAIATYTCIDTQIGFNNDIELGVMDGFYAIEYGLSNLYIYATDPDYSYVWDDKLYDGTDVDDLYGLYKIDISSLGLTE